MHDEPETLDQIMLRHKTDKSSAEHDYAPLYEDKFRSHRDDALTLLELGVWRGSSLRVWRDYFPNATIIGLDRNRPLASLEDADVVQFQAEQQDEVPIDRCGSLYGPFNIIIDDASHISSKTIRSFELLWPHLAPGGIYVIEDLQTSYDVANYGHFEACRDPDLEPWRGDRESPRTAMQFCKRLADEVNHGLYPDEHWLGHDVASVEFALNICFVRKHGKWSAA